MPTPANRPSRPLRPTVATVPPLPASTTLDPTHRQIVQHLVDLERMVQAMADGGDETQIAAWAKDACRFFHRVARDHHDAEEGVVFPRLLRDATPELLAHIRRLQQDHAWLEEDWLELEPHLQAVASGWRREHQEFLQRALPEFTALYHAHIALEEAVVYPLARRPATATV